MSTAERNHLKHQHDHDDHEMRATIDLRKSAELHTFGDNAHLFDSAMFEHCHRIAKVMAGMSILPDHLRIDRKTETPLEESAVVANCFRIVNQAIRWGFDPYAIVDETYVVGGKLGYQGKLIAAVVNTRAGLVRNLDYEFKGSAGDLTVVVSGMFRGEDKPRQLAVRLSDARTSNDMWTKDPRQKLVYTASIKWARRYCPEVILGVRTDDDLERIEDDDRRKATPTPRTLKDLTATIRGDSPAADESTHDSDESGELFEGLHAALEACASVEDCETVFEKFKPKCKDANDEGELVFVVDERIQELS